MQPWWFSSGSATDGGASEGSEWTPAGLEGKCGGCSVRAVAAGAGFGARCKCHVLHEWVTLAAYAARSLAPVSLSCLSPTIHAIFASDCLSAAPGSVRFLNSGKNLPRLSNFLTDAGRATERPDDGERLNDRGPHQHEAIAMAYRRAS